jgi:hypothetical protein
LTIREVINFESDFNTSDIAQACVVSSLNGAMKGLNSMTIMAPLFITPVKYNVHKIYLGMKSEFRYVIK